MFCPNCGKASSVKQKFCRSCGLSLEKTAQSLAEQLPIAEQHPVKELDNSLREKQLRVERWIKIIVGSTISLVTLGVLWGIIYKVILVKGQVLMGLVFLGFILGLITFALLVMYRESLVEKSASHLPSQTSPLPLAASGENALPESSMQPLTSVTERTTDLLRVERRDDAR